METTRTFSGDGGPKDEESADRARLVLSLECARPLAPPRAYAIDGELTIGRGAERRLEERRVEVPDPWMSGRHARVVRQGDGWKLEDLGSKNGTFIDGQRVTSVSLHDGDVLEVAGTTFVFRHGRGPMGDELDDRLAFRTLCAGLRDEMRTLERIARAQVPVLLHGESGTGKEVVARAVHDASGRRGPFVALNCASLPAPLVESELFGARRGAYSGADSDRPGLILAAHGGTLFLDEIAELAPHAQATLLRTLQEREVRPLGGAAAQKVDVRIIAATHQDLAARVQSGTFRQDLYARLRGYRLVLPPLRERRDDLGLLVAALLGTIAPERAPALRFDRVAARALFVYEWPLNIRELEHALRAAVAIAPRDEIELAHLPEEVRHACDRPPPVGDRERFVELARQHRGNVTALARALHTSRTHVRRLARRHAVDLEAERGGEV